jgi:hypothetical protein
LQKAAAALEDAGCRAAAPIAEPLGFESYNATLSKAAALFTPAARVIRGVINSCANQFPARYALPAFSLTLYWLLSGGKILVYLRESTHLKSVIQKFALENATSFNEDLWLIQKIFLVLPCVLSSH